MERVVCLIQSCHQDQKIQRCNHQTEQSESGWYFSGAEENPADESRGSWEVERKKKDSKLRFLESVCVQHEIDHLNGITIHDREIKIRTY